MNMKRHKLNNINIPVISLVSRWIAHRKWSRMINEAMEEDGVSDGLSRLFQGAVFRRDRGGRIYAVINPMINNGKYDPSGVVIDEETGSWKEWMDEWVMQRMIAAQAFIRANNLFELLTYELTPLDDSGNCLLVLAPLTLQPLLDAARTTLKWLGVCAVIGAVIGAIAIFTPWL